MQYHTLGKTGLKVSALGVGGHEFNWWHNGTVRNNRMVSFDPDRQAVIETALEGGVNYFDTTFFEEVHSLGHEISRLKCRDQMVISSMVIDPLNQGARMREAGQEVETYVRQEVETRLELLGSDHFDIFLMGNLIPGYDRELALDIAEVYQRLREEGKFQFIGVSAHDFEFLREFVSLDLPIDVVMFWYSYPMGVRQPVCGHVDFEVGQFKAFLEAVDARQLGKVAMKPLTWFHRALPFYYQGESEHDATACQSAMAWQTRKGEVHTSALAVDSSAQMAQNISAVDIAPDEALLHSYLGRGPDLEHLIDRSGEFSDCQRQYVARACQKRLDMNLGDDPAAYRQHVQARPSDPAEPTTELSVAREAPRGQ